MVYLYAGLGVVMLGGIMAIFEMGLSLKGKSFLPIPVDNYPGSSEQATENNFLAASQSLSAGLTGINICIEVEGLPNVPAHTGKFLPVIRHSAWNNGCVIEYGLHQVLLAPKPSGSAEPYLVLFCRSSDKNSLICPFEEIKND